MFADAGLMELNERLSAEAWQARFSESLPPSERGRKTDSPRLVRVPVLLTEPEARELDEARGEMSRSEFLRRSLQVEKKAI